MSNLWRNFARRQQKIEKTFIPKVEKAIRSEVSKAMGHYRKHGNIGDVRADVLPIIKDLYKKTVLSEAALHYSKLKERKKYLTLGQNDTWNKIIDTYLLQHNIFNTVEKINETTKRRILELISQGLQKGDSVDMIVKTIEADDIPLKRAQLIVRTESVGAMNMGGMIGAISTGIMYQKKWVTAGDHRVRGNKPTDQFSHVALDGDLVDMGNPFNNGQSIMFPGDKRASPGNFCNCRCCMSYVAKRDERGRIMRYAELAPTNPGMTIGQDGKLSDLMLQIIVGQIFGQTLANYVNNN